MSKAKAIRDAILADVTDRRGWRQAWDSFDDDVKEGIKAEWLRLIEEILEPPVPPVPPIEPSQRSTRQRPGRVR